MMPIKKKFKITLSIVVLSLVLFSFNKAQNDKYFEILKNLDIFATMYKELNANYVDDVNPNTIMETGIDAMLKSLDPYTVYYPEDQIEDVRTENTGQFGGIGAIVGERYDNKVMIVLPNEGFSAQESGLKRGDEIVEISGINVERDYEKAAQYLSGQVGDELQLKVRRYGELLDFEVPLVAVTLPNVPYYGKVTEDIGFIKLTGFREDASGEVKRAYRKLKKDGVSKVILDLRGNPGGLLGEAVNIANIFIDKGKLAVTTKGKLKEMNAVYNTLNAPVDTEVPVAVLLNSSSASASEVVSGVIQDYDRGVVVGRKSYGKGLVQRTLPLSYNSQMKVTIAKYYTPSGRCIQAIDYSNRNEDGSVGQIADSLKTQFRTENGRPVFDGGGVDPDFIVSERQLAPVTKEMLVSDFFFRFVSESIEAQIDVEDPRSFELPELVFTNYLDWLKDKELDYTSELLDQLDEFESFLKANNELDNVKSDVETLRQNLEKDLVKDATKNKEQMVYFLREEIILRSLLEDGQIEGSFANDLDVQEAIRVLNDADLYNQTLSGN